MANNRTNDESVGRTTVRLSPKLLRELKHAAIDRDIDQQDAIMEGIALWLAGKPLVSPDALDHADKALAAVFPRFLKEADPGAVEWVRGIIRAWQGIEAKRRR